MRSILLHVYDDTAFSTRLQAALDLARRFNGHITCMHATPFEDYLRVDPWIAARLPEEFSDKMKSRRQELKARIENHLKNEGVSWDWMHVDDEMSTALIRHSIVSDVIVLSMAGVAMERDEPRPLAPMVAIRGRAPCLVIPQHIQAIGLDRPIVIAWNGSPEAAAAVRSALPLLQSGSEVLLLEVEDKISRYPRDLIARYLSRHDVKVKIIQRRPIRETVSVTIRVVADEAGAGLIVMGAYGHSRLRELLLGGVTRDLIFDNPIPLLLAH